MRLDEYANYDGMGLGELVRLGEVTPQELATCALKSAAELNPTINAVIECYEDRIEQASDLCTPDEIFSGVPFFLKDIGAAETGQIQEMGSRLAQGVVVEQESFLTRRFKESGVVILGRTTTPEFGLASTTESVMCGETRNPWQPEHIAGGSSGGAAAAVAAGIVPIAHASDGGGSIRIPASCCGLVGLKPSRGRNSMGPGLDEYLFGYAQEHIVSRSVRDTAAILDYTSKPGSGDPFIITRPNKPFIEVLQVPPSQLRIGFTTRSWIGQNADPEIEEAVRAVALEFESMGHRVEEVAPTLEYEPYLANCATIWIAELNHFVDSLAKKTNRRPGRDTLEPVTLDAYEQSKALLAQDLIGALSSLNPMRRSVGTYFEAFDILLTPTLAQLPPKLGTVHTNQNISFQQFRALDEHIIPHLELFNITGQPAISLPAAQGAQGLPIGIQLAGRFGGEALLLRLAHALELAMPWIDRRPPVHCCRA